MMWLDSVLHYFTASTATATLIGLGALAIAILEPKFMDAITDLRKWAIVTAACAFSYSFVFGWGYEHGLSVKQDQWNEALAAEIDNGNKARADAVATVRSATPDRVRNDRNNRDNWPKPLSK